jgi:hypothetical protein
MRRDDSSLTDYVNDLSDEMIELKEAWKVRGMT